MKVHYEITSVPKFMPVALPNSEKTVFLKNTVSAGHPVLYTKKDNFRVDNVFDVKKGKGWGRVNFLFILGLLIW